MPPEIFNEIDLCILRGMKTSYKKQQKNGLLSNMSLSLGPAGVK